MLYLYRLPLAVPPFTIAQCLVLEDVLFPIAAIAYKGGSADQTDPGRSVETVP